MKLHYCDVRNTSLLIRRYFRSVFLNGCLFADLIVLRSEIAVAIWWYHWPTIIFARKECKQVLLDERLDEAIHANGSQIRLPLESLRFRNGPSARSGSSEKVVSDFCAAFKSSDKSRPNMVQSRVCISRSYVSYTPSYMWEIHQKTLFAGANVQTMLITMRYLPSPSYHTDPEKKRDNVRWELEALNL